MLFNRPEDLKGCIKNGIPCDSFTGKIDYLPIIGGCARGNECGRCECCYYKNERHYKERELTEDQYQLVMHIKQGVEETLYDRFQKFWIKRCANDSYLSDYDSWWILSQKAKDMFDKSDWYNVNDCIRRTYQNGKSLSARDMVEIYLTAIQLMWMREEIK